MAWIKTRSQEGQNRLITIGGDILIWEINGVEKIRLIVSDAGHLSFEGVPLGVDPEEAGAIWVDENGFVRASLGPAG